MGFIIVSIIVIALCALGLLLGYIYDNDVTLFLSGVFLVCGIVALVAILLSLADIESTFRQIENQYDITKEIVSEYVVDENYGNSDSLTKQVFEINNAIAEHRAKCNSRWFGLWYSEEIGNLEPIHLPVAKKFSQKESQ